jgi:hypothetical protein
VGDWVGWIQASFSGKLGKQITVMDNIEEFLENVFPTPEDGTVDWLCYCLSQNQVAFVIALLELNASDCKPEETGAYMQRIQRLRANALKQDDEETLNRSLKRVRELVEKEQLW